MKPNIRKNLSLLQRYEGFFIYVLPFQTSSILHEGCLQLDFEHWDLYPNHQTIWLWINVRFYPQKLKFASNRLVLFSSIYFRLTFFTFLCNLQRVNLLGKEYKDYIYRMTCIMPSCKLIYNRTTIKLFSISLYLLHPRRRLRCKVRWQRATTGTTQSGTSSKYVRTQHEDN